MGFTGVPRANLPRRNPPENHQTTWSVFEGWWKDGPSLTIQRCLSYQHMSRFSLASVCVRERARERARGRARERQCVRERSTPQAAPACNQPAFVEPTLSILTDCQQASPRLARILARYVGLPNCSQPALMAWHTVHNRRLGRLFTSQPSSSMQWCPCYQHMGRFSLVCQGLTDDSQAMSA